MRRSFIKAGSPDEIVVKLVRVFDVLDAQKIKAEEERQAEKDRQLPFLVRLRAIHRNRHRATAQDENHRIDRAPGCVEVLAAEGEKFRAIPSKNRIQTEQPSEQQHFRTQKQPHAEFCGFKLLPRRVKVMS